MLTNPPAEFKWPTTPPKKGEILIPDEHVYPCFSNRQLQEEAFRKYVTSTSLTLSEIASAIDVPEITVQRWAAVGGWDMERAKNIGVVIKDSQLRMSLWRAQNREEAAKRQVALGERIQEAAMEKLLDPDALTPDGLKKIAEAGKAGTDVEARALNVGNISGEQAEVSGDADDAFAGSKGGKAPLVVVIPGGGLPIVPKTVTVDPIESEAP